MIIVEDHCIILQNRKRGEDRYQYNPAHYLLATVELPVVSQVLEASIENHTSASAPGRAFEERVPIEGA
jgi:hypothetical protein